MKPKFTKLEYYSAKSIDLLPCECYECHNTFYFQKKMIIHELKHQRGRIKFCCFQCSRNFLKKSVNLQCVSCNKIINKTPSLIKQSKSGNYFCSRSCAATYNNTHKKHGTRISKLEKWLEIKLIELYPNLEFHFNRKDAINSELDIYIPSLKLAFELNGIFHYEPIYGEDKLQKIQNNDNRKFQACLENGIEFCGIDTSQQKYFKEKTSFKYLNIIISIISIINDSKNVNC